MLTPSAELGFVWIARHARERLQEHHPNIGVRGATERLHRAMPVAREIVSGLLARPMEACADRYFLDQDRRGLFVVTERENEQRPGEMWRVLVTFIRFQPSQVEQVNRLWPAEEAA